MVALLWRGTGAQYGMLAMGVTPQFIPKQSIILQKKVDLLLIFSVSAEGPMEEVRLR